VQEKGKVFGEADFLTSSERLHLEGGFAAGA
jgi:hypothetical protein